jgi:hypothetical protein
VRELPRAQRERGTEVVPEVWHGGDCLGERCVNLLLQLCPLGVNCLGQLHGTQSACGGGGGGGGGGGEAVSALESINRMIGSAFLVSFVVRVEVRLRSGLIKDVTCVE